MAYHLSDAMKTTICALATAALAGIPYYLATPEVQPAEKPLGTMAVAQLILLGGGFVITYIWREQPRRVTILLLVGMELFILGRILIDYNIDPRSHNLAPFEFVVALILCAPASFLGPYFGHRILSKRQ